MRASTRLASGAAPVSARAGAAPRTRGARGGADASRVVPSPQCSVGTLKRSRSLAVRALARGRDAAYYEWIDAKGIEAPSIGIGYVGGGIADDNETYRGCVATAPIAAGTSWGVLLSPDLFSNRREKSWKWRPLQNVLRFFPVVDSSGASAILSLPRARAARRGETSSSPCVPLGAADEPEPEPEPKTETESNARRRRVGSVSREPSLRRPPGARPTRFPRSSPTRRGRGRTSSRPRATARRAHSTKARTRERSTKTADWRRSSARRSSCSTSARSARRRVGRRTWRTCRRRYDLLSCWTDEQLGELRCAELEARAKAQRAENARARRGCGVRRRDARVRVSDARRDGVGSGYRAVARVSRGLPETFTNDPESAPHPPYPPRRKDLHVSEKKKKKEVPSTFVLPLLDAFNHLSERGGATKLTFDAASQRLTLRAARDMRVGDEVTISYGARSNGTLLLRFGFAVFDSTDETVPLPGCADELEWLMPGSAREAALFAEGLHHAVRGARVDRDGKANTNLLWALRVLLASDEDYERVGGAKGFRDAFPSGLDGRDVPGSGAQLAAEASLALACAREMDPAGGPRDSPRTRRSSRRRSPCCARWRRSARDAAARTTRATRRTKARWTTGVWALRGAPARTRVGRFRIPRTASS